jgi:acyl-CoA reductase-like NAD-dependent aldehyde dehydrogenase
MSETTHTVRHTKLYINGKWEDPTAGGKIALINPATESALAEVAAASSSDVDRAVAAARKAFEEGPWTRKMNALDRSRALRRLASLIERDGTELAWLETVNCGKPISETTKVDIPFIAEIFDYYAGWAGKWTGETIPVAGAALCYTLREPVGVVAAIVPWNFPLLLAAWKIAPALALGNTLVVKPSQWTPLSALKFAALCEEAGIPEGVVNVLPGRGGECGDALVAHPGVDMVAFTGSTEVGKSIMRKCADTVKRVSLELGGKSPNIVFADADLEAAARGATMGIFYNKGEVCAAGSRLLVEKSAHEALVRAVVERSAKMAASQGDPLHPKTRLGPQTSKPHLDKILKFVEAGKAGGAKLLAGGKSEGLVGGKGYFMRPTVFDGVTAEMTIAREEIFGPVLSVLTFEKPEEALALANDTPYGLAAAVWTRDAGKAHRAAAALRAGTVWVNCYNLYDAAAPFGGYKQSGFGRELGRGALEHFSETKTVWVGTE